MVRTRLLFIALVAALGLVSGCASSSRCGAHGCGSPSCCDPCGPCCDGPMLSDCGSGCCPSCPSCCPTCPSCPSCAPGCCPSAPMGMAPFPAPLNAVPPLSAPPGMGRIAPQPQSQP